MKTPVAVSTETYRGQRKWPLICFALEHACILPIRFVAGVDAWTVNMTGGAFLLILSQPVHDIRATYQRCLCLMATHIRMPVCTSRHLMSGCCEAHKSPKVIPFEFSFRMNFHCFCALLIKHVKHLICPDSQELLHICNQRNNSIIERIQFCVELSENEIK